MASFSSRVWCPRSAGIPVAIFGSATLSVYDIDTSTLKLGDAKVKVVGKKSNELCSFEDIGSYDETYFDNLNPTPDGHHDLLCTFDTYDIFQTAIEGEVLEVLITGTTMNGADFKGSDQGVGPPLARVEAGRPG